MQSVPGELRCTKIRYHIFSDGCLQDSLHRDIYRVKCHIVLEQRVGVAIPAVHRGTRTLLVCAKVNTLHYVLPFPEQSMGHAELW